MASAIGTRYLNKETKKVVTIIAICPDNKHVIYDMYGIKKKISLKRLVLKFQKLKADQ